ncbi:O-antigen ligase family protein [Candidatus Nomurabacteria bacterium]|nr:O-antigen ligase family protein [Candidatus Nomurabacteria bacterium]
MTTSFLKNIKYFPLIGLILIPMLCLSSLSDQYTHVKWIAFYFVAFFSSIFTLINRERILLPRLGKISYIFLLVIVFYVLSALLNQGNYENQLLDWLTFFTTTLLAYNLFINENIFPEFFFQLNLLALLLISTYGFLQYFGIQLFSALAINEFPSSFFGFQNMSAEFVGSSLILQTVYFFYCQSSWSRLRKNIHILLLLIAHLYLFFLSSRTAFASVIVANSILFIFFYNQRWKFLTIISTALVLLMFPALHYKPQKSIFNQQTQKSLSIESNPLKSGFNFSIEKTQISALKKENINIRFRRWRNTLELFKKNWLFGIGPGNYEFGYIPFQSSVFQDPESTENSIVRSPHNGYLEALAENGLFFTLSLAVLVGWMLLKLFFTLPHTRNQSICKTLAAALLVYILTTAFTAFPLENAYPFYLTALSVGFLLSLICKEYWIFSNFKKIILFSLFTLGIGILGAFFTLSKFNENNFSRDKTRVNFACNFFPSNWKACSSKATLELEKGKLVEAERTVKKILAKSPNNFVAIRLLSLALLKQSKWHEACIALKIYDDLFYSESSLHLYYLHNCK